MNVFRGTRNPGSIRLMFAGFSGFGVCHEAGILPPHSKPLEGRPGFRPETE